MYFGVLSASTEFDSSCPPPLFFSLKNHPIFNVTLFLWTTLLNGSRHRPNAEPRRAAVLCRRRYVLLNRIMQNSQFWGKNDALPSFALYFTVTTFWNVLELNKKKGSEPLPIQINQDSVSVTNLHWSFWPLSVISFFLAYQISIC